jgi:hypothetical protein
MQHGDAGMRLPTRKRGYQSEVEKGRYAAELEAFCRTIIGIKSTLGFAATARGYSYYLEGRHIITKGEFAAAEKLIGECRKNGALPYNVCATDETRVSAEVELIGHLREHGACKVEANALMAVPAAGRQLCLDAITRYIPESAVEEYENRVDEQRANLAERIAELIGDDRD